MLLVVVVVAALLATSSSCNYAQTESVPSLDHGAFRPATLFATQFNDSPAIGHPSFLRLVDNTLWVADASYDPSLHAIDAESGELLYSLGRRGEGPGEFARGPFGLEIAPGDPNAVWAWDLTFQRLTRFERRTIFSEDSVATIRLAGAPRVHRVVWNTDGRIVGVAKSEEARFSFFSPSGERLGTAPGHLLGPDDVPEEERWKVTNSGIRVCSWPGRGFVIINMMIGRIEYYDLDARFVRLAAVPFASEPGFVENDAGELKFDLSQQRDWYLDCVATADHLFALFSGRLRSAFEPGERDSADFLHVFDWSGQLRTVFKLERSVRPISIDPSATVLYAGSLVDSAIYRFAVPEIAQRPDGQWE